MIINKLNNNIVNHPDKTALIIGEQKWSYKELSIDVQKITKGFSLLNISKGAHIGLLLGNCYEFVLALLAAAATGTVVVPLNKTMKSSVLSGMIQRCDIAFFIVEKPLVETVLATELIDKSHIISTVNSTEGVVSFEQWLIENVELTATISLNEGLENTPFIISTTSGSTGQPKPIVFTQATKLMRSKNAQKLYSLNNQDTIIAATPLYHSLALRLCLLPLLLGGTSVILPKFSPVTWLRSIEEHRVSFSILVSSQIANILLEYKKSPADYNLESLHTLVSSSALIQPIVKKELIDTFDFNIHEIYGASEVGVVTNLSPDQAKSKLNTVGRSVEGVEIKIVDEGDNILPVDTVGEIICQSEMVFSGYYKFSESPHYKGQADYFYTGDLGKIDQEGFLTFVGRKKDMIITGGINTYPSDIEQVLMASGLLKECAVVGVEDKRLGEAVVAVVVPIANEHEENKMLIRRLQRICYQSLEDYQQPLHYEVSSKLAKNAVGKIDKRIIQQQVSYIDATKVLRNTLA